MLNKGSASLTHLDRLTGLILSCGLAAAVILSLAACGGNGNTGTQPDTTPQATPDRTARDVADTLGPDAVAGQDYSPTIIEVGYLAGVRLPGQLQGQPIPDQPAARRPNDILRQNPGYTTITDAIAGRYGLEIRNQVYIRGMNTASFNLPEGTDGAAVLTALRSEFAAVLDYAGFTPLAHGAFIPDDPDFQDSTNHSGQQWGQRKIHCEDAWDYTRGDQSVLVGVVDTGVRLSHEELDGQVLVPEEAFPTYHLDIANDDNTVEDDDGHGTKISGLIAAKTDNTRTIAGAADGCRIIPVKIANSTLIAPYTDMAAGCVLAAELGARVVNLSWTGDSPSGSLKSMVILLAEDGVLLTVAAGNDADGEDPHYPGAYDGCMAVGSTTTADLRSEFSNYGDYVDIAAPGEGLKSCHPSGISEYQEDIWGTSYAAPLVAAGAALLWSYEPKLALQDVRSLLETTGADTYEFNEAVPVKRLDLAAAFDALLTLEVPYLDQLVYRDTVTFTATPNRPLTDLYVYVNETQVDHLTSAPWEVALDLSSFGFTILDVDLHGYDANGVRATTRFNLLVDNTNGVHSFDEGFDDGIAMVNPLDPRDFSDGLLGRLKQLDPAEWSIAPIRNGAGPDWELEDTGTTYNALRLGETGHNYRNRRTELLVTPQLNLAGMVDAQFSFNAHHNFAGTDLCHLLYTTDLGYSFSPVMSGGDPVVLSGYQGDYLNYSIDLDPLLGEKPYFVFLFESDAAGIGSGAEEDASLWLDDIQLSGTTVSISGLNVDMPEVPGQITGATEFSATVLSPLNVTEVIYWVDYAPLGTTDTYDIVITNTKAPFDQAFDLTAALSRHNEAAVLRVTPVGFSSFQGETLTHPVYVFNQLGDTNGDGLVDESDAEAYSGQVGLTSGDEGYNPLCDSDLDGTVTEMDANHVGYLYGTTWE